MPHLRLSINLEQINQIFAELEGEEVSQAGRATEIFLDSEGEDLSDDIADIDGDTEIDFGEEDIFENWSDSVEEAFVEEVSNSSLVRV